MDHQSLLYNENYQRTFKRGPKHTNVDTKKRKIFITLDVLVGVVGVLLLMLALLVSFKGGWSGKGYADVSSETVTALYMLAVFALFTSVIGGFGAYTYWKTLIVTYSILALMCLAFHIYIIFLFSSATSNTKIHMARSWWDKINEDVKVEIQDKYSCCGYLDIKDFAVSSATCPQELIDQYTLVNLEEIKKPANVEKKDSYFNRYSDQLKPVSSVSSGTVTIPNNGNNFEGNNSAGLKIDNGNGAIANQQQAGGNNAAVGQQQQANGNVGALNNAGNGELRRRQMGQDAANGGAVGGIDNGAGAGIDGGVNGGVGGAVDGGAVDGGAVDGGVGNIENGADAGFAGGMDGNMADAGLGNTANKQVPTPPTSLDGAPQGCEGHLVPLVSNKLKTIKTILMGLTVFYVLGSCMGWIYWKALRGFKEFDEFA